LGADRRKKRSELLPFPDRRGIVTPNGGHPVPVPVDESEQTTIEQASKAYRVPGFMKPRKGGGRRKAAKQR
jgi:hypothetical protein